MVSLLRAICRDARYDTIGRTYTSTRRADPRIAAQIAAALGDARRVVNVGAGTGSYEPDDRVVVAVDPSATMLRQRAAGRRARGAGPRRGAAVRRRRVRRRARDPHRAPLGRPRARPARDAARRAPPGRVLLRAGVELGRSGSSPSTSPRSSTLATERAAPGLDGLARDPRRRARRAGAGAGRLPRRLRRLATGTGPRRTSTRRCRPASRAFAQLDPDGARAAAPSGSAATSRPAPGTSATATLRDARRDRSRLPAARRRADPILTAVLRLVLPKGSLEQATLQLFEDADLALDPRLRRRLQGDDRRPARRRRHDPAPAGDPALRRRRSVRRRRHRPRLDRGDERRGRDPDRAALLEGHGPPDPHGARGRRRLAVAVGRPISRPTCACTPSTRS